MFELTISKQQILSPLLMVAGAVDKKQSFSILSNILLQLSEHQFSLTATDLEIQITAVVPCSATTTGAITVPARKIIDIFRSLDDEARPTLSYSGTHLNIKTAQGQFKLITLPAADYPIATDDVSELDFTLQASALVRLLQATHFAMAQQDVRAYLNGMFLEMDAQCLTAVGADGHRMAVCRFILDEAFQQHHRLLIPKKGAQEMLRLLSTVAPDERVGVSAGKNHISVVTTQFKFSSKLIEARFPPYARAIPKDHERVVLVDRDQLKRALSRIVILANEKLRAVVLRIEHQALILAASNKEQEEGVETLAVQTEGEPLIIGLNATYLIDVLNYLNDGLVRLSFGDADSSILAQSMSDENYQYIIMPMKL